MMRLFEIYILLFLKIPPIVLQTFLPSLWPLHRHCLRPLQVSDSGGKPHNPQSGYHQLKTLGCAGVSSELEKAKNRRVPSQDCRADVAIPRFSLFPGIFTVFATV